MATPRVTIDALPEQATVEDTNLIVVQDADTTKKMTLATLKTMPSAALDAHLADTADAHDASAISTTPSGAGVDSTTVQGQLGQLAGLTGASTSGLADHLADTTDAHDATAISAAPHTGVTATHVQGQLEELATALSVKDVVWVGPEAPTDPVVEMWWDSNAPASYLPEPIGEGVLRSDHAISEHITPEPGAVVCWSADDGYTTFVDYFNLLNTKGIKGTLFLTKNWVDQAGTNATWGDTYITTAQVQAIANAGHELASHGVNHEQADTYLAANGAAALQTLEQQVVDYIESTYGVEVTTGAYPGGRSDEITREVVARNHQFFRGTKGVTVLGAPDPFDIPGIDVLALTEAQIKAHVDFAVANRNLVVFLTHGGINAAAITKFGNVMDYVAGLGVPQKRFDEAMTERTSWRGSAGAMIDTQGNARFLDARATRFEVHRQDVTAGKGWWDIDETTSGPYFDSDGPTVEMRAAFRTTNSYEHGRRTIVYDGVLNSTTTVTSAAAVFNQADVGITIAGTGIPGGATITVVTNTTTVTISAAATATASAVTLTLGRPAVSTFNINVGTVIRGDLNVLSPTEPRILFQLPEATAHGQISPLKWSRAGAGGGMIIDSGTGGSNIDHKAFRHRFWDHAGARKIAIGTADPTDASIANGELVMWFDATVGASKVVFKGKNNSGTVVTGNLPLV